MGINYRPDVETTQINYTNACSIGIWQRWYSNLEPNCIMSCSCKYNPNCYYKQLKAKEQECEELKKRLIKCDDNIIVDCEYSKKDLCSFIHRKKEVINGLQEQLDQLKAENKHLNDLLNQALKELEKTKETLIEIKEIAKIRKDDINDWLAKEILQKIRECEGE